MKSINSGRERFVYSSIVLLLIFSTLTDVKFQLNIGPLSVPYVYLLQFFSFVLILSRISFEKTKNFKLSLIFPIFITFILLIPTVFTNFQIFRISFIFQIVLNIILFQTLFNICRFCPKLGETAIKTAFLILFFASVIEIVFFSTWNSRGEKTFWFSHAKLFTGEEGWLGIIFGLFAIAFAFLGDRYFFMTSIISVLIQSNRSSFALIFFAILIYFNFSAIIVRIFSCLLALSTLIYGYIVIFKDPNNLLTRLDTTYSRVRDMQDVLSYNQSGISWFGFQNLLVYSSRQARILPFTSNTLYFDFYWKFGLYGLIYLGICLSSIVMKIQSFYAKYLRSHMKYVTDIFILLFGVVAQFNNCFRMPWIWSLLGAIIPLARKQSKNNEQILY